MGSAQLTTHARLPLGNDRKAEPRHKDAFIQQHVTHFDGGRRLAHNYRNYGRLPRQRLEPGFGDGAAEVARVLAQRFDEAVARFEQLDRFERARGDRLRKERAERGAVTRPLFLDDPERAELFWRLSVPISAFVLLLLAIPLSYVNPRMGRSFNLIAAAFMYMVYSNCLNIVQSFIAQGRLSMPAGLVLIHSIAIAVVVVLFWNRLRVVTMFRRRRPVHG